MQGTTNAPINTSQKTSEVYPLTVVIATLGGPSLIGTIDTLNQSSLVPDEILICIPKAEQKRAEKLSFPNVKIIVTDCRGQVAQRAVGFQRATHSIVMQLDDDLFVDRDCISHLVTTLKAYGPKVSVAPAMMNLATGKSIYKKENSAGFFQKISYWLFNGANGYQPGKICKSGLAIGIDPDEKDERLFEVDWFAGGCALHYKENLLLENFYPFQGKAYCEDLFHSYHLTQAKVKLMVDVAAKCWLHPATLDCSLFEFLKQLHSDFRARKHAMRRFSRFSSRMYIYYFARYMDFLYKKLVMRI